MMPIINCNLKLLIASVPNFRFGAKTTASTPWECLNRLRSIPALLICAIDRILVD
jgi:hypothetical protein